MRAPMRFFLILFCLLSYTTFKAVQFWPEDPALAALIAMILFVIMLAATFIYRARASVFDKGWWRALTWTGSLMMGAWATFILLSLPVDLVHLVLMAVWRASAEWPWREISLGLGAFSLVAAFIGFLQARGGPRVVRAEVPVLNPALRGLKIAQISDLHVGPTIRQDYARQVVARVNDLNPDFICLTGDVADAHVESIHTHLAPLGDLKARYGSFYVTGNHEYYWGAEALLARVRQLGLTPLINENRVIAVPGGHVLVGGVTDPMGARLVEGHVPDVARALKSEAKADFKLLLAHRPDVYVEAEDLGFDLQLSGHTHAGQFFPFSLLIGLAHKYYRGLHHHGRLWLYVNPGTGYWGPANRFAISAEITLITLA